ncbi:unnamed protein product [Psylliodes chrysocephalus]|uniref:Dynein light chain n=1 Tax=Psylliodes chrysocephalus TaxID=3402493 RepID=A0A9P0GLK5_9CUCU|nr:unnamed protein product [Psylliodes chrysocephala]
MASGACRGPQPCCIPPCLPPPCCPQACVKSADMCDAMQKDAISLAMQAMYLYTLERDVAAYIKKEFDKRYCPFWHCAVGKNFSSYITHESSNFIFFFLGCTAFVLYKSG